MCFTELADRITLSAQKFIIGIYIYIHIYTYIVFTKNKCLCRSCNSVRQFTNTAICAADKISLLCFVLTVIVVG